MRTTVTLDDDVLEAARAQAKASGKRLGEVLSQLARRGLCASRETATKGGLPVFELAPDSDIVPSGRANELLAEEMDFLPGSPDTKSKKRFDLVKHSRWMDKVYGKGKTFKIVDQLLEKDRRNLSV